MIPKEAIAAWEEGFQALQHVECEWIEVNESKARDGWRTVRTHRLSAYELNPARRILITTQMMVDRPRHERWIETTRGFMHLRKEADEAFKLAQVEGPSNVEPAGYRAVRARFPAFAYSYSDHSLKELVSGPGFRLKSAKLMNPREFVIELETGKERKEKGGHFANSFYRIVCDPTQRWARTLLEIKSPDIAFTITHQYTGITQEGWPKLASYATIQNSGNEIISRTKGEITYIGPSRRKEAEFTPEYYGLPSTIFDQISGPSPKPWWWTYGLWGGIGVGLLFIAGWLWRRSTVARHG